MTCRDQGIATTFPSLHQVALENSIPRREVELPLSISRHWPSLNPGAASMRVLYEVLVASMRGSYVTRDTFHRGIELDRIVPYSHSCEVRPVDFGNTSPPHLRRQPPRSKWQVCLTLPHRSLE